MNLLFPTARKRVEEQYGRTYAGVTAQNRLTVSQANEEVKTLIAKKDAEITALQQQMEKLKAFIKSKLMNNRSPPQFNMSAAIDNSITSRLPKAILKVITTRLRQPTKPLEEVRIKNYHIYELESSRTIVLSTKGNDQTAPKLQNVLWAPGRSGDGPGGEKDFFQGIAFVHGADIYYKPKVQGDLICRITSNGKSEHLLNGVPDWLYSNVAELKSATLSFSPDGHYLSYLSFNISTVHKYQYIWYGNDDQYPSIRSIRYPKLNSPNPGVMVHVVNLSILKVISQKTITIPSHISKESYVGGMIWISAYELSVTFTNREQNVSYILLCAAPNFNCSEIFSERATENGWALIAEAPYFIKTERKFGFNATLATLSHEKQEDIFMLKRLSVRVGPYSYFRHIALIPLDTKIPIILTIGPFEVTEIIGYDTVNECVYYMAAPERKPGQRHLYKVDLTLNQNTEHISMKAKSVTSLCISCDINVGQNKSSNNTSYMRVDKAFSSNCMFNKIFFNSDYSYYVQECIGPDSPASYIVNTTSGKMIFILDNGDYLKSLLFEVAKPQIMTFSVQIRYDFHAQVRMYLPPGIEEDDDVQLPLILHVDASPESQLVSDRYKIDWNWYICSFQSYIIAQIDARGSGFQGESLKTQIRGKVGIEVEDQLSVLTYLRDNVKLVDANRICIYGWGYGGYISSLMIVSDTDNVIKCGVAINPIVSFKYFYSFFTERYVVDFADDDHTLIDSDLSMKAGNFARKKILLVHGTADTFVHEQHVALLTKALIEANVMFRHQVCLTKYTLKLQMLSSCTIKS
ncbi:AAEL004793-PA [Aedes aegypti]|uniref:AAEL004793-PA n=1 Tax=Aedes aegypti TaxID=7159 RepID=Q17BV7_AEDAE|nr:AAEL004793-PA [Aedes aegypti]